ncbi:armadillo-like helical domain containing protein 1 isoform X2 [Echeneis naucrates]|uniref:armadillo-like helical domain containing protein 1 isoform X2 n=1 Tax=Echeneis naucrates TaxID=173247 RepID=UPI00111427A8|nr:armadillo-like helical domain containing protein 1 isoform X2 [Echeneis naucrates]
MPTHREPATVGRVLSFLRDWDRGDRTVRSRMLNTFIGQNAGKTTSELESEFAEVSSLFLARLTTWIRLTYTFGKILGLQLSAINIFLSASGHNRYLSEFLQDEGVLTLLDILSHTQIREEDKAEALHLLLTISNAGRKYKEIICESHGAKVVAECLAESCTEETQGKASVLLESLCQGNPKHQKQIYRSLISVMACNSPKAQLLILRTLRTVQSRMKTAHHSIVEPLLNMLRSLHLGIQDEELKCYDVKPLLLSGLVGLLKPTKEEVKQQQITQETYFVDTIPSETEMIKMNGSLSVFVQQAAAAKAIRMLAEQDQELSCELLALGVSQCLLCAMGNREHSDAQIQASLALKHFVCSFPVIKEDVQRVMGRTLFEAFMHNPASLYMSLDEAQAEIMLTNKMSIPKVLDGEIYEG